MTTIRPLTEQDAGAVAALHLANRAFMAPTEPHREDDFYTEAGQAAAIAQRLEMDRAGTAAHFAILDDGGEIIGQITLNSIVRGPLQSGNIGYWVSEHANGRGIASAALALLVRKAFDDLNLHRLDAGTLLDNHASQRVLLKAGFTRYGLAPQFLRINGQWRDHVLFQLINDSYRDDLSQPPSA